LIKLDTAQSRKNSLDMNTIESNSAQSLSLSDVENVASDHTRNLNTTNTSTCWANDVMDSLTRARPTSVNRPPTTREGLESQSMIAAPPCLINLTAVSQCDESERSHEANLSRVASVNNATLPINKQVVTTRESCASLTASSSATVDQY